MIAPVCNNKFKKKKKNLRILVRNICFGHTLYCYMCSETMGFTFGRVALVGLTRWTRPNGLRAALYRYPLGPCRARRRAN